MMGAEIYHTIRYVPRGAVQEIRVKANTASEAAEELQRLVGPIFIISTQTDGDVFLDTRCGWINEQLEQQGD